MEQLLNNREPQIGQPHQNDLHKLQPNKAKALKSLKLIIFSAIIMLNSLNIIKATNTHLSEFADISILTCSPGDELYSTFGHTGIRVKDPVTDLDIVFNYGTFNFQTHNFYLKFARGLLNYQLVVEKYDQFIMDYIADDRAVFEQVLSLSFDEKNVLFEALLDNAKPENREYQYHFFFDNCATRVRDIIDNNIEGNLFFDRPKHDPKMTFRHAIAEYLKVKPWTKLGLDLILGRPTDERMDEYTVQFLPDYLMEQFSTSRRVYGSSKIIMATNQLLKTHRNPKKHYAPPVLILSLAAIIVFLITRYDFKRKKSAKLIDIILFGIPGLLGLLILFLWFFTNHTVTGPNWHIIWASPLLIVFFFWTKYNDFYKYFTAFLFSCQLFCLAFFALFIQHFPLALIPVWIMIMVRIFLKFSEVRHLDKLKR